MTDPLSLLRGPSASRRHFLDGIGLGVRAGASALLLAAALLSAGCANRVSGGAGSGQAAPPVAQTNLPPATGIRTVDESRLPPALQGKVRIGLILPLTGPGAQIGEAMEHAADMALFDTGDDRLALLVHDTGGSAESARAAAQAALDDGAALILGPVFAAHVAAVAEPARLAGVNVIAFSTDETVAADGIYLIGILPRIQVERIIGYASSQGMKRIAVLAPLSPYGDRIVDAAMVAAQANGATIVASERYDPSLKDITQAVKSVAGTGFDAVLVPEGGDRARAIAPLFAYYNVDPRKVKLLGTALWDDPALASEAMLIGGWFAAPQPDRWIAFRDRYAQAYGSPPPRLASLAYDATALAAALARQPSGPDFSSATLTQESGFDGIDGIFRFRPDGTSDRGLAVLSVQPGQPGLVDPAPSSFETLGY